MMARAGSRWPGRHMQSRRHRGSKELKHSIGPGASGKSFRSGDAIISRQLEIRAFRTEDFEELYAIDQACYPPSMAYSRAVLKLFLYAPETTTLVATWAGQVAGFVTVEKKAAQQGHIITLDVREAYRRRGIGCALLEAGERWLVSQGVSTAGLETAVDNPTAIEFWKANGYAIQGRIRHYYGGAVDAWMMRKALAHLGPHNS